MWSAEFKICLIKNKNFKVISVTLIGTSNFLYNFYFHWNKKKTFKGYCNHCLRTINKFSSTNDSSGSIYSGVSELKMFRLYRETEGACSQSFPSGHQSRGSQRPFSWRHSVPIWSRKFRAQYANMRNLSSPFDLRERENVGGWVVASLANETRFCLLPAPQIQCTLRNISVLRRYSGANWIALPHRSCGLRKLGRANICLGRKVSFLENAERNCWSNCQLFVRAKRV